jgi:N-ethylmaleimide reductase
LDEVIASVATVFPLNRIGVRLSPNGAYNDMGSEDSIELYTFVLKQLAAKQLLYTHVMDGLTFGFHQKSAPFTIDAIRAVYGPGSLIANCGYTRDTAEAAVAAGHADAVAFGRPFIGNPDLVHRFAHDLPLSDSNPATWFTHAAEGYTTYPTAEASGAVAAAAAI